MAEGKKKRLEETIDWARRGHWIWIVFPASWKAWVWGTAVTTIAAVLAYFNRLTAAHWWIFFLLAGLVYVVGWVVVNRRADGAKLSRAQSPLSNSNVGNLSPLLVYEHVEPYDGGDIEIQKLGIPVFVRIKNAQVDIENLAEDVTAKIEYSHADGDRHTILRAPWHRWIEDDGGIVSEYPFTVTLRGDQSSSFILLFSGLNKNVFVSQDCKIPSAVLKIGRWTAHIHVTGSNTNVVDGLIGFVVLEDGRLRIEKPAYRTTTTSAAG